MTACNFKSAISDGCCKTEPQFCMASMWSWSLLMKIKWPDCKGVNKWEQSCSIMELIREISNDFGILSFIEVRFDGLMCVWFWTVLKSEVSPLLGIHFESGSMEPSDESGLSEPSFWRIFLLLQLLWNLCLLICWWGYKKPILASKKKKFWSLSQMSTFGQ